MKSTRTRTLTAAGAMILVLAFQNCSHDLPAEVFGSVSPAPVDGAGDSASLGGSTSSDYPLPDGGGLPVTAIEPLTYTMQSDSSGVAAQLSCKPGYSVVSATELSRSGRGACLPQIKGATVYFGSCSGQYRVTAVCAKVSTETLVKTSSALTTTESAFGPILSATEIEVPSGALSCLPSIAGSKVNHGGCGVSAGQNGYALLAVAGKVLDTKIASYTGSGNTVSVLTCPQGYLALSASEVSQSGRYHCIPGIDKNRVTFGGCGLLPNGETYTLRAVCGLLEGAKSSAQPTVEVMERSPFPGAYSAVIKHLEPSGAHSVRLALYDLKADGSVEQNYWTASSTIDPLQSYLALGIPVGTARQPGYAYAYDSAAQVQGNRQLTGTAVKVVGAWKKTTAGVDITWSNGATESWSLTWKDADLFKLELTFSSQAHGGFNLRSNGTRDPGALNAGWAFGAPGVPVTFASTVAQALTKDYSGETIQMNSWLGCVNEPLRKDSLNLKSLFNQTTSGNVARYVMYDDVLQFFAFYYYTKPAALGIAARRVSYQFSHDYSANGRIDDEVGHTQTGLEIIDAKGRLRGVVLAEASPNLTGTCSSSPNSIGAGYYITEL